MATIAGDRDDYLRQPFTATWRQRFADFDAILGDMTDKLHAAGVPLLVIPVPSRKQAALISSPQIPSDLDPFAFSREIEMIASKHGAVYVSLTDTFSHIPNSDRLFYVVDNHPTAEAQSVIANSLVQKLKEGSIPAFSNCTLQQTAKKE